MSRNRNHVYKSTASSPVKSRSDYNARRLIRRYGSLENVHLILHKSTQPHKRKYRSIKPIVIPGFNGWTCIETRSGWLVIPPRGRIGDRRENDVRDWRGSPTSVIPVDNTVETTARRICRLLVTSARMTQRHIGKGIKLVKLAKSIGSTETRTAILIKRRKPAIFGSKLCESAWILGTLFCQKYAFHMGVS